jgi:RNA polymerase sigma factor (sigma-70 family)
VVCWDDIDAVSDREELLLALLGAIVASSMTPLAERELIGEACHLLSAAWADFEPSEVRRLLRGDHSLPGVTVTSVGLLASMSPPTDIGTVFARSARAEALAALVADLEGPGGGAGELPPKLFTCPLLSVDSERRLGLKAHRGDYVAIRKLVMSNTRLAAGLARRKVGYPGLDHEDFFQEATLGLFRAAEKFDPYKGFKFSTYATWWVRQAVARAVADKSRTVRVPVHVAEKLNQIHAMERRRRAAGRDEPVEAEIALETGWSLEDVAAVRQAEIVPEPLDAHLNFANPSEISVEDEVIAAVEIGELKRFLKGHLTDREIDVLTRRLGLFGRRGETLDQIGVHYNVTRERIRQIENQAMKKLVESDEAKRRRGADKSPRLTEHAAPLLEHPVTAQLRKDRNATTADRSGVAAQGSAKPPGEDETRTHNASTSRDYAPQSLTTSERTQTNGDGDSPERRGQDRTIAAYATMLLSDPDTGRPAITLGGRHIEMLRETLTRCSDQPWAHPSATRDLIAIRAIARGEAAPTPEQKYLLEAAEQAFCEVAAAPPTGSPTVSTLGTRVMAAMLHAIDVSVTA